MAVSCRPCRCDSVYCAVVTVLVVVAAISKNRVHAFDVTTTASSTVSTTIAANTGLYSTTPPRQPRRNLQKRPRKNRKSIRLHVAITIFHGIHRNQRWDFDDHHNNKHVDESSIQSAQRRRVLGNGGTSDHCFRRRA